MAVGKALGRARGKKLSGRGLAVAWAWLALVTIYSVWGAVSERGLYGWLMRRQIELSDGYSGTLTLALPLALLGSPSVWALFGHFLAVEQEAAREPALARRYTRTWAFGLLSAAALSLTTGLFSIVMAMQQPGPQEPVEIDASEILAGRAPASRLRMIVHPVRRARYEITETGRRGGSRATRWTGFRPLVGPPRLGEPDPTLLRPSEPVALFYEGSISRGLGSAEQSESRLADRIQVTGYVVENGLPEVARRGLARQGVRISEPHFLIRDEAEETRWMVGIGLGLFGALIFGVVGGVLLLKGEAL